jgi:hypothetical protein
MLLRIPENNPLINPATPKPKRFFTPSGHHHGFKPQSWSSAIITSSGLHHFFQPSSLLPAFITSSSPRHPAVRR